MLNKIILIGNLGKDPEVRHLESGSAVARITVATNENYKDKSGEWQTITEWHDVIAWRYLAEKAERDLKKGSLVYVEGKIQKRKWQDKEGVDRYSTEVIAAVLKPLERKPSSGGSFEKPGLPAEGDFTPISASSTPAQNQPPGQPTNQSSNEEDDLPF